MIIKTNVLGFYCLAAVMSQISVLHEQRQSETCVCSFEDQSDLNMQSVDLA